MLSAIGLVICILWLAVFTKAASDVNKQATAVATVHYEVTGDAKNVTINYTTYGRRCRGDRRVGAEGHSTAGCEGDAAERGDDAARLHDDWLSLWCPPGSRTSSSRPQRILLKPPPGKVSLPPSGVV